MLSVSDKPDMDPPNDEGNVSDGTAMEKPPPLNEKRHLFILRPICKKTPSSQTAPIKSIVLKTTKENRYSRQHTLSLYNKKKVYSQGIHFFIVLFLFYCSNKLISSTIYLIISTFKIFWWNYTRCNNNRSSARIWFWSY
jgi:hypothetical protein